MSEELSDLVRQLGINKPIFAGINDRNNEIEITPYDKSHVDFLTEAYSVDNKDHLEHFVTKGWSPSIEEMKRKHGEEYQKSEEYETTREQRHQNTIQRNSKDRYFFTILENGKPIGYTSVVEKEEEEQKIGRVSVMIGFEEDCNKNSGSLALRKMLEVLVQKVNLEFYDGKVEETNDPALRAMRRVFGVDVEVNESFDNVYRTLDGQEKIETVQRKYFKRPRTFFLQ